jgi:hypothetical protein
LEPYVKFSESAVQFCSHHAGLIRQSHRSSNG